MSSRSEIWYDVTGAGGEDEQGIRMRDGVCTMDWVLGQAQGQAYGCVCKYEWRCRAIQRVKKDAFQTGERGEEPW